MLDATLAAADRDLAMLEQDIADHLWVDEDDVADVAVLVLGHATSLASIAELDAVLRVEIDRDFETLARVVDVLTGPQFSGLTFEFPGGSFSVDAERPELLEELEAIRGARDPLDAGFRLDFYGMRLSRVVMTILANGRTLSREVDDIVAKKLPVIDDREAARIWALIKSEFRATRSGANFSAESRVLPPGFLETSSVAEMRTRIGEYMARIKPRLMVEQFQAGQTRTPATVPDIVKLLTATHSLRQLAFVERQFLHIVSKLLQLWEDKEQQLLEAMGLSSSSWVSRSAESGRTVWQSKIPSDPDVRIRMRIRTLRRLISYADSFATRQSPLEDALNGFRLGREVMAGDLAKAKSEKKKLELVLQRELARFRLERGHFAVGTKFGRSETDLIVTEGGDVVVIEAKRYTVSPTADALATNLGQLQTYVSQQRIPSSRGVLLVFNFSRRHLVAPRRWIRQQFMIVPVNLGPVSPSETRETLTLEEAQGDRLVVGFLNRAPVRRAAPRRR